MQNNFSQQYKLTFHVLTRVSTIQQAKNIEDQYQRIRDQIQKVKNSESVVLRYDVIGSISKVQQAQVINLLEKVRKNNIKNMCRLERDIIVVEDITRIVRNINQVHKIIECLYDFYNNVMNLFVVNTSTNIAENSIKNILHKLYPLQKYDKSKKDELQQNAFQNYFICKQFLIYEEDKVIDKRYNIKKNIIEYQYSYDENIDWCCSDNLYECIYTLEKYDKKIAINDGIYVYNPTEKPIEFLISYEKFIKQSDISNDMLVQKANQGKFNIQKVQQISRKKRQMADEIISNMIKEPNYDLHQIQEIVMKKVGCKITNKQVSTCIDKFQGHSSEQIEKSLVQHMNVHGVLTFGEALKISNRVTKIIFKRAIKQYKNNKALDDDFEKNGINKKLSELSINEKQNNEKIDEE